MCVLLLDVFIGCSSLIKELNSRSQSFDILGKKTWSNALTLKSKKMQGIFGETLILAVSSSAVFCLLKCASDFFKIVLLRR